MSFTRCYEREAPIRDTELLWEEEMSASYIWERVSYMLQSNKEITDLTDSETKKSWFYLCFTCYLLSNKAESSPIQMWQTWSIAQDHQSS